MPAGMNIGLLKFQFTLPLRGVTDVPRESNACFVISIHTPLAGSDAASAIARPNGPKISIHTPLAGSDSFTPLSLEKEEISIHTPLAGSDRNVTVFVCGLYAISIHTPLAGSDCGVEPLWRVAYPISIHTPLAGSDWSDVCTKILPISIHTPLAGSDSPMPSLPQSMVFQSTLPLRGVTPIT